MAIYLLVNSRCIDRDVLMCELWSGIAVDVLLYFLAEQIICRNEGVEVICVTSSRRDSFLALSESIKMLPGYPQNFIHNQLIVDPRRPEGLVHSRPSVSKEHRSESVYNGPLGMKREFRS